MMKNVVGKVLIGTVVYFIIVWSLGDEPGLAVISALVMGATAFAVATHNPKKKWPNDRVEKESHVVSDLHGF